MIAMHIPTHTQVLVECFTWNIQKYSTDVVATVWMPERSDDEGKQPVFIPAQIPRNELKFLDQFNF